MHIFTHNPDYFLICVQIDIDFPVRPRVAVIPPSDVAIRELEASGCGQSLGREGDFRDGSVLVDVFVRVRVATFDTERTNPDQLVLSL